MTYIVSEPCIKCKYTDCVAVCPAEPDGGGAPGDDPDPRPASGPGPGEPDAAGPTGPAHARPVETGRPSARGPTGTNRHPQLR